MYLRHSASANLISPPGIPKSQRFQEPTLRPLPMAGQSVPSAGWLAWCDSLAMLTSARGALSWSCLTVRSQRQTTYDSFETAPAPIVSATTAYLPSTGNNGAPGKVSKARRFSRRMDAPLRCCAVSTRCWDSLLSSLPLTSAHFCMARTERTR
jgi:hypothetical protein